MLMMMGSGGRPRELSIHLRLRRRPPAAATCCSTSISAQGTHSRRPEPSGVESAARGESSGPLDESSGLLLETASKPRPLPPRTH